MTPGAVPVRRGRLGFWVAGGVALVVIVFGVVFAGRIGVDPQLAVSPVIGRAAPSVTMPFLDGDGELALTDLEGDVVVVNFWSSWCLGCRVEHEALLTAAAAYGAADVSFVGILHQDQPGPGLEFLNELGRAPQFEYVVDRGSRAGIGFGVLGLPQTFFLDRAGIVRGQVSGPVNLAVLGDAIDALLRGDGVAPITQTGEVENR